MPNQFIFILIGIGSSLLKGSETSDVKYIFSQLQSHLFYTFQCSGPLQNPPKNLCWLL